MTGQGKRIQTFNQSLGAADWGDEDSSPSEGDWNSRGSNEGNDPDWGRNR